MKFYEIEDNYNKIFVFKKGFTQYKLIPYDIDNKIFILISKNNKWKFIKYEGDFSKIGKLEINVVFSEDNKNAKDFEVSEVLCNDLLQGTKSKIPYYQGNEFRLFGLSIWNKCNKLKVLTKMYNFIKQYYRFK